MRVPVILLASVFLASAAAAQPSGGAEDTALQPQTQGTISFISGGRSSDERDALRQMQSRYNLRLQFAVQRSGEYLANVNVTVTDAKGATLLDAISDGPLFYAQLPAGRYHLTVTSDGKSETRNITVPASGAGAGFLLAGAQSELAPDQIRVSRLKDCGASR